MMKSLRAFLKFFSKEKISHEPVEHEEVTTRKEIKQSSDEIDQKPIEQTQNILKKRKGKVNIQVGIDFGTSATKVVFLQLGKRPFRVVNFAHGLFNYPSYCIPSVGCMGDNGKLLLGVSAAKFLSNKQWDSGLQRLKVIVAAKYDNSFRDHMNEEKYYDHFILHKQKVIEPDMLSAVFLSYVINNTRKIIKNYPEYRDVELDLAFNVCMPIDHVQNSKLKNVFERIFYWAELIDQAWDKNENGFNPLKAARILENSSPNRESKVFAVPEAVASFASYLVSLRKREGLHAIVDFGSGTTDLSICNLSLNTEKIKTFWYAARNIPRGTVKIERALAAVLVELSGKSSCTLNDICDCLDHISPYTSKGNKAQTNKGLDSIVFNELCDLRDSKEYKHTWGSAYRHLKKDYLWKDVEIFTCGGGSNFPHVDKAFSEPWWQNLNTKYRVTKLPVPDNYQPGSSGAPFERMSVAYGLAIPYPQLDEFTLPADSPDHTPPSPAVYEPDRDDLYPK